MAIRYSVRKLGTALSRELDVAIAVAREEVLEMHTAQLLELVELSSGRVTAERISDIYLRLHQIQEAESVVIRNRSLAVLGIRSRSIRTEPLPVLELPPAENGADAPRGPFRFLRERFRGRVHNELRRWVELHTGRAELALLEVHVRNSLRVVKLLSEHGPMHDAIQYYRERAGVRDQVGEVIYWTVLSRLAETDLPVQGPVAMPVIPDLPLTGDGARKPNGNGNGGSNGSANGGSRRAAAVRTPYRTV
jgi:hypothetical protein